MNEFEWHLQSKNLYGWGMKRKNPIILEIIVGLIPFVSFILIILIAYVLS